MGTLEESIARVRQGFPERDALRTTLEKAHEARDAASRMYLDAKETLDGIERLLRAGRRLGYWPERDGGRYEVALAGFSPILADTLTAAVQAAVEELDR